MKKRMIYVTWLCKKKKERKNAIKKYGSKKSSKILPSSPRFLSRSIRVYRVLVLLHRVDAELRVEFVLHAEHLADDGTASGAEDGDDTLTPPTLHTPHTHTPGWGGESVVV